MGVDESRLKTTTAKRRSSNIALLLRWLGVAVNLVLVSFASGPRTIRWIAFLAVGLGAFAGALEHVLPLFWKGYRRALRHPGVSLLMGAYDMAWMALLVYATGGIDHGFWTRYFVFLVARAILLPPAYLFAFLAMVEVSFFGASFLAHNVTRETVGVMGQAGFSLFLVGGYAVGVLSSQRAAARRSAELIELLTEQNGHIAEAFDELMAGNLSQDVKLRVAQTEDETTARLMEQLSETFTHFIDRLRAIVRQVQASGAQLATASQQLLAQAEEESVTATGQAVAVTETSTTIQELAQTAAQIAEAAEAVAELAEATSRAAAEGHSAVAHTSDRMERISERASGLRERTLQMGELSQEIGAILSLIDEISDQTNLLALNAAIEAARAGEYGRGFSVVADEVRKLAERSQAATKDVQGLVAEIRTQAHQMISSTEEQSAETTQGREAAASATGSLSGIADMAQRTTGAVREISIATAQQRSASEQVVSAMTSVANSSEQFAAGSQEATVAAADLSVLAKALAEAMSNFRVD